MPHVGAGIPSWSKSVGVPEKGRNAGIALGEELDREDTDEILDILNGRGKTAAKTGQGFTEICEEVKDYDFIELGDTGRAFPRPVFTSLVDQGEKVTGYDKAALEQGFDRFYQGFDRLIEENCSIEEISQDFEDLAAEVAAEERYSLNRKYGDDVKWSAMNTDLEAEPETVLIPEEFPTVGMAAAEKYWENVPEYRTFRDYRQGVDEEQILAESPVEIAGIYMVVSGTTAEEAGLAYEPVPGFESRLARFTRKSENQYKNSEGITE